MKFDKWGKIWTKALRPPLMVSAISRKKERKIANTLSLGRKKEKKKKKVDQACIFGHSKSISSVFLAISR